MATNDDLIYKYPAGSLLSLRVVRELMDAARRDERDKIIWLINKGFSATLCLSDLMKMLKGDKVVR